MKSWIRLALIAPFAALALGLASPASAEPKWGGDRKVEKRHGHGHWDRGGKRHDRADRHRKHDRADRHHRSHRFDKKHDRKRARADHRRDRHHAWKHRHDRKPAWKHRDNRRADRFDRRHHNWKRQAKRFDNRHQRHRAGGWAHRW